MIGFLLFAFALFALIYFLMYFNREKSGNWLQFFAKGKEAGFTIKDLEQLRRLVAACNLKDPISIFSSQSQFEIVIRSMVKTVQLSGEYSDPVTQIFLSKLFDYFKKIELETS